MKKCSTRDARGPISRCDNFDTYGSFYGQWEACDYSRGYLPEEHRERFTESFTGGIVFVVYSYATPIAWYDGHAWTIPQVKYSATTSKHQSIVTRAVASDAS